MTYREALEYIHSVTWKGSRPGLSRITELLDRLGNPQNKLRFVHIAGTNGKGSTSAMTESVLRAAGYKTGLFVSPYIKDFNERICVAGSPISDEELAAATATVRPHADAMEDAPTEFELITAIGLVHFLLVGCEIVVLETGMGGRLDSTNVIKPPLATIITGIAMDHTAFLGDTVEAIAAEKAGIIKKGTPVVWGGDSKAARAVIEDTARRMGAPFVAAEDTSLLVKSMGLDGTVLDFGERKDVFLPLLGAYQPQNLATVLCGIDVLKGRGLSISEEAVREGLRTVSWRGRFERLSGEPPVFFDGAHNPQGVAAAVRGIKQYFPGRRVVLLSGVMADKDYSDMIKSLSGVALKVFTLTPDNPRSLPAAEYAKYFLAAGVEAEAFPTVEEAVRAAISFAAGVGAPVFALGSLYMYGEVSNAVERALQATV